MIEKYVGIKASFYAKKLSFSGKESYIWITTVEDRRGSRHRDIKDNFSGQLEQGLALLGRSSSKALHRKTSGEWTIREPTLYRTSTPFRSPHMSLGSLLSACWCSWESIAEGSHLPAIMSARVLGTGSPKAGKLPMLFFRVLSFKWIEESLGSHFKQWGTTPSMW